MQTGIYPPRGTALNERGSIHSIEKFDFASGIMRRGNLAHVDGGRRDHGIGVAGGLDLADRCEAAARQGHGPGLGHAVSQVGVADLDVR